MIKHYNFAVAINMAGQDTPVLQSVSAVSREEAIGIALQAVEIIHVAGISALITADSTLASKALVPLLEGKKIAAIKIVREATNWNLRDSKLYVEDIMANHGITWKDGKYVRA
jgi:ribosomal protein L7/L12